MVMVRSAHLLTSSASSCEMLGVAIASAILVQELPPDVVVCRKPRLSDVENVQPARMLTHVASIGSAQHQPVCNTHNVKIM